MTFDQLQEGDVIFLDANIFVYHFLGLSQQCKQLLGRCRNGFLQGKTASFILAETVHRLMIAEAIERKLVTTKNALKRHVDSIHWNPVKHGFVTKAVAWPYSTFHRYVREGVYPADWGTTEDFDGTEFGE